MELEKKENNKSQKGLSQSNRGAITAIYVLAMLIIEPYGIRIPGPFFLFSPIALYWGLHYLANMWNGGEEANNRLNRVLSGIIALAFFALAIQSGTSGYHDVCTQAVMTRDGSECVGEYVRVKGANIGGVLIAGGLGCFAIWYSVLKQKGSHP